MKEKVRKEKRTVILKGWKSLMKKEKEKRWKKGLTNGRQCGMIYKLSFERAMMFEKYTVRKSGNKMSESKSITTIAQGNWSTLSIPNKVLANFTKTLVFKIELINFRKNFSRVWSWLRTNAGGVPNTCKSSENFAAESFGRKQWKESGGRVSNAWVTCLQEGDNIPKGMLIPHDIVFLHGITIKDLSPEDGLASD